MPRTASISWSGFSHGEDSAKAAIDPLSLADGFCELLQNIEPGNGRLAPRYGCSQVSDGFGNITWMGEYQKAGSGYFLVMDSGSLWSVTYPGGIKRLLRQDWFTTDAKISQVRSGRYLILAVDSAGLSMVVYEKDGVLQWMPATLDNVSSPIVSAKHELLAEQNDGSAFQIGQPRMLSYTWVKLDDTIAQSKYDLTTGMPSAQLESWENINNRVLVSALLDTEEPDMALDMSNGNIVVSLNPSTAPAGATHLRVYCTISAPVTNLDYTAAEQKAAGLVLRWLCDIPVTDMEFTTYLPSGDNPLMGSTNLAWSTGRDDIPPGGWVKFANGRLWVGGSTDQMTTDNPGRVYHSALIDGATEQLSRLLSFCYMTDYIDTSTDESEPCIGAGLSQGNLILFNPNSVYLLKDASPDYSAQHISNLGCVGAITEINQRIFYISTNGPATVSGSVVEAFDNMKSVRATPRIRGYSDFHSAHKINGFWHNDSWIVSDGKHTSCFLMRGDDRGTWTFEPGVEMSLLNVAFPVKDICLVGGGGNPIYRIMDPMMTLDGSKPFLAKMYTNGTKVPKGMNCAEAYSIRASVKWSDDSQLKTVVLGDHGRLADLFQFDENQDCGSATLPVPVTRGPVLQGVQAGAVSHWFQCGVEKYIWGDTLFGPIELELIPRKLRDESVSISAPEAPEPTLDSGYYGWNPIEEVG